MTWVFHKRVGHANRQSRARYRLLKFFALLAKTTAGITPGQKGKLAWTGFNFRLRAFTFFEHINIILDLDPRSHLSLVEALQRIEKLGLENRMWALEGVGYIYGENILTFKEPPSGLLRKKKLPRWSIGSLHSGMGMAFATWFLKNFQHQDSNSHSGKKLEYYLNFARENSMSGCGEIPVESLGFIARLLYPAVVPVLDRLLQEIDRDLAAYFWHGVGRAFCFLPGNIWPARIFHWRTVKIAVNEAPHELGYLNILSGLAWPFILVNLKEPRILEYMLLYQKDYLSENDAFADGVSSAIVFLLESIHDGSLAGSVCDHKPDSADTGLLKAWHKLIKTPCDKAVKNLYPYLDKKNCWSELFKYRQNTPG